MKILVTGGAGFIGSNFIRYWLKTHSDDMVVNFDKLTYAGHLSSTKDYKGNKSYRFIKGSITNAKAVDAVMKGVDYVVHFAAESHVDRSIVGPQVFVKTNVVGTQILMDAALRHKVKRFHHISTDEVFGALSLTTKNIFTEKTPYDPRSPYSASKAASDHLVRAYHETFGLPATITNTTNNYGPYQDPEKLIPRSITNLIDGNPITIYGDGKHVRDWVHVEDHVTAVEAVLEKGVVGETYVVGGQQGKEYNNLEIAQLFLKAFGYDEKKLRFVKDRPGHDRRYAADSSKIMKKLGWKPRYTVETGMIETIQWYRDNEWWWRPLKQKAEQLYQKTGQK